MVRSRESSEFVLDEPTEEIDAGGAVKTRRLPADAQTPFVTAGTRLRDGRYVLERMLGRGGMAAVWLARDERLDRPVAVKMLSDTLAGDEDYLTRFRREAKVAASLSHPNLVQVYDFDAGAPRPCLVMEYIPGGDLAERLERGDAPDRERLARDLLAALRQIHAAGVLHRDVKPQNVLIGRDGRARLTDFGIARPRDATSLTQTGQLLGTARYLAPELMEGHDPTERTDLYSLGILLDEVGGRGGALDGLIARLRAPDPADRPPSADAALRELDPAPSTPRTGPPPATAPTAAHPGRDPRRLIAALALAIAAVVAIVLLSGGDDARERPRQAQSAAGQSDSSQAEQEASAASPADRSAEPGPASGAELNDQGYAMIQQGRYEEAIPILERAVTSLRDSGDQLTYGYALFNLAHALRLAGRPEEAIPLLEERLEIPNQTDVVQAELDAALADAGLADDGAETDDETKPPKPPKGKAKGHEKD
jgi:hypothetical protein